MKRLKKILTFVVLLVFMLSFAGCSESDDSVPKGGSYLPSYSSGISVDGGKVLEPASSKRSDLTSDSELITEGEETEIVEEDDQTNQAGLITASAWDDNQYYSMWKDLFKKDTEEAAEEEKTGDKGKFSSFEGDDSWDFFTTKRVTVTVKNGEDVIQGAAVTYFDEQQKEYAAKTDARGVAYLFPSGDEGTVTVKVGNVTKTETFTAENKDLTVDVETDNQKESVIKIMLVVDVTGSMGDELTYLKNELADVITRVATENQNVRIDLALLFYRDNDDNEKFSYSDFVTVTNQQGLAAQQEKLKKQTAAGGGDYPEAVDEALALAMAKDWGDENSTKIIFHVLDAPPHSYDENKTRFNAAVNEAAKKGIRLCPILCSGADPLCEYLVRHEAIITGGTFIFVTDHSGIGNPHYDPNIPNAVVEKLNDLMVRLINGYYTGTFADPVWWNAESSQTQE